MSAQMGHTAANSRNGHPPVWGRLATPPLKRQATTNQTPQIHIMKNKHIAEITVSTKKGHSQLTRWLITQDRPHPSLHAIYGIDWQNAEGLFPRYNQPQIPTIGTTYRCSLLRSDIDLGNLTGNRNDCAGYAPDKVPHPGCIELRGRSLGELDIKFDRNPEWPEIRQDVSGTPSHGEREWVMANIIPQLRAYIAANAESLKAEAVESLKAYVAASIAKARKELDEAEAKMNQTIAKL